MQYIQQGDKEQEGDASIIAMFLTAEQCAVGKQRSCYMEHNHFCVTHTHSWSCNMGLHVLGMATAVALFFHWSLVSQDHANASCSHKLDNSCPHTHTHTCLCGQPNTPFCSVADFGLVDTSVLIEKTVVWKEYVKGISAEAN